MAVDYPKGLSMIPQGLKNRIDKQDLLDQSKVDFIPLSKKGKTLRTQPLMEDSQLDYRQQYLRAGKIYLTNPLCFVATRILSQAVASGNLIVKEKQGNTWVVHTNNTLDKWLDSPNETMDKEELIKAYMTHLVLFGKVSCVMFQKGDVLPNGDICERNNTFDIVYPTRIDKDYGKRNSKKYYYYPMRVENALTLKSENVLVDVVYNPMAHETGVAYPNNPLHRLFEIDEFYHREIEQFFLRGGVPQTVLRHIVDQNKDSRGSTLTDDDIEEKVQEVLAQISRKGRRPNGILGLNGNWDFVKFGTPLKDLIQPELIKYTQTQVRAVFGIPPAIFWAGLDMSSGRSSRQNDNIDFYYQTINPHQTSISKGLGKFLIPKFFDSKWKERFMLDFDISKMPLAQYIRAKDNRQFERWWTTKVINRGKLYEYLEIPTDGLTDKEKKEYYDGGKNDKKMDVGRGEQSIEEDNGYE